MTLGWSEATANGFLAAVFQGTSFAITDLYAQLHVGGEPGATGMSNVAGNNVRASCAAAYGTAPSGGSIANDGVIGTTEWASVSTTETYGWLSLWLHPTDTTAASFVGSGILSGTGLSVNAGDPFTLPIGDVTAAVGVAS
jgi:hypothetical protein